MKLGIVGHEAAKFTDATEQVARRIIRELIEKYDPEAVVSGECPLGGVDIWTRLEAKSMGKLFEPKRPLQHSWDGAYGFKARNLDIATSDIVACIVVEVYPSNYRGRRFEGCYHCDRHPQERPERHVKGGGCWTAWKAKRREWHIV